MQTAQTQKPFRLSVSSLIPNIRLPERGVMFLCLILCATVLFEAFNFSTTEHALDGVMGGLRFVGVSWSTILALAFCGIDFAGIAHLFSPQERPANGRLEGIYLLAAWLLAGMINAATTWWAVTVALLGQPSLGNEMIARGDLLLYVPILVAGAVWLIRILLIGTLTLSSGARTAQIPAAAGKPAPVQFSIAQIPGDAATVSATAGGRLSSRQGQFSGVTGHVPSKVRPFTGGRS
ncbi:MAG: hypothetical protein JW929_08685 [Anaerolineales bacterium]|nr:hypothetical protein [Anaerolineales bacterium]